MLNTWTPSYYYPTPDVGIYEDKINNNLDYLSNFDMWGKHKKNIYKKNIFC